MFDSIKDFLLNKALGRILVRVIASGAMYLASGKLGFQFDLTPEQQTQLVGASITGINALISKLKSRPAAIPAPALPEAPAPEAPKA